MNRGYFSPENMTIAPANYPNYIERLMNIYKIAPLKPKKNPMK